MLASGEEYYTKGVRRFDGGVDMGETPVRTGWWCVNGAPRSGYFAESRTPVNFGINENLPTTEQWITCNNHANAKLTELLLTRARVRSREVYTWLLERSFERPTRREMPGSSLLSFFVSYREHARNIMELLSTRYRGYAMDRMKLLYGGNRTGYNSGNGKKRKERNRKGRVYLEK